MKGHVQWADTLCMASARLTKVAVVNFMIEESAMERDRKRVDGKNAYPFA